MFGEQQLLSPVKRQLLMQRIINNMNEISKPVSTSPIKRRIRIQSNRIDYRKNLSMVENDSNRHITEPNNTEIKKLFHIKANRKMSQDQMHPKSPPMLPSLFEITFQNPFFGQFSQRKAQYQRPTEFQAIVYKRKS
ncbi:unnamed protein product (macronuclear) [Paramecium tetraurelia]|uniref:Uncharacterized protein n=1 Tax=Paramecium tetraurelia TaxID=5888 RepID=A0D0B6_PARTE|nr:uncharacterized protein GSPATT00012035001 [Paramecium tetraurelia]CAK76483.1 unnamed protein product [Paramecium tetraurelia]|eukprot:XP_001443880.1 hypothetical protein (macronuclear) [Paramecium tetraurelia strain d4-2]